MKWTIVRTLKAMWPPLPVWQRLDAAVGAVALYTLLVVGVEHVYHIEVSGWSGATPSHQRPT